MIFKLSDDGNNIDGDGCSFDCKVEAGYECLGGTNLSPDICINRNPIRYSIKRLSADGIYINNKENTPVEFELIFSKEFTLTGGKSFADFLEIKITGMEGVSVPFTIQSNSNDKLRYKVLVSFKLSLKKREIVFKINNGDAFTDSKGNHLLNGSST